MSDASVLLREMSQRHLERSTRRRLEGCLRRAGETMGPDELPVALTDGFFDGAEGLLVLTTDRVFFIVGETDTVVLDAELDLVHDAAPVGDHRDADNAHLDFGIGDRIVRIVGVGDLEWAQMLADAVDGDWEALTPDSETLSPSDADDLAALRASGLHIDAAPGFVGTAAPDHWDIPSDARSVADQIRARVAADGGAVTDHSDGALSGHWIITRVPSLVVTVVLTLLCWVAGILYYVFARGQEQETWSVRLVEIPEGTRVFLEGQPGAYLGVAAVLDELEGAVSPGQETPASALWARLASLEPELARTEGELMMLFDTAGLDMAEVTEAQLEALAETGWVRALSSGSLEEAVAALSAMTHDRSTSAGGHEPSS